MDPAKWTEWAGRASATTLLVGILITGQMGIWVWGSNLADIKQERETWKALALKGTNVAQDATLRAIPITGHAPISFGSSLKANATAAEVAKRLDMIKSRVKFPSDPTDSPVK